MALALIVLLSLMTCLADLSQCQIVNIFSTLSKKGDPKGEGKVSQIVCFISIMIHNWLAVSLFRAFQVSLAIYCLSKIEI